MSGSVANRFDRRTFLQSSGVAGISWLTPLADRLARAAESQPRGEPPRSVIVLWLQGGPSQLETFDPHPGTTAAAGTEAIDTAVPGIRLAKGLEQLAEQMGSVSLIRSVVGLEGDHERATYNMKTGYRPDPTLVHPSLGAVICHQLPDRSEIPRHVSILSAAWPARGGYLGDQFDAFQIGDPQNRIPDVHPRVDDVRAARRVDDLLNVVERQFARGRLESLEDRKTLHRQSVQAALAMMSSDQLKAFDVRDEPRDVLERFGDNPFGRGCLAAVRLIAAGVRCVEVTLGGWDSHVNNHEIQAGRVAMLDPALASLIRELRQRNLLDRTILLCGGEFGRTPRLNPAGGRDHWPHGFSIALAGGGLPGGRVIGVTAPEPKLEKDKLKENVIHPKTVADIHATVLHTLGIDYRQELLTPIGRPMQISQGTPIAELIG